MGLDYNPKRTRWVRCLVTYQPANDLDEAVRLLWEKYGGASGRFRVTHISAVSGERPRLRVVADYVATGANPHDVKRRVAETTGYVAYTVHCEMLATLDLEHVPLIPVPDETELRARDGALADETPQQARKRRGVKKRQRRDPDLGTSTISTDPKNPARPAAVEPGRPLQHLAGPR